MHVTQALTARDRSREATRMRLLHSARTLFSDHGLHGVTSHDIARGAGVAAGTFYLHYKDKESVFREIVYDAIDRMRDRLREARRTAPDPAAGVRAHAEALISFAEENRDLVRIVFGRDHGAAKLESDVLDRLAAGAAEAMRERTAAGTFSAELDAEIAAQALTGMFARVVGWWIENPSRATRESMIETLVHIQLYGTGAQAFSKALPGDGMKRKGANNG